MASVVTIAFIPRLTACDSCLALALVALAAAPKNEPTSNGQHHAPTSDGADATTAIAVSTRCDDIASATLRILRAPVAARARLETYSSSDRTDSESLDPSSFSRATSRGAIHVAQRPSSSSSSFARSSGASSARGIERRRASTSAGVAPLLAARMSNEPDARAATTTGALALDDDASAKFVRFYRALPSEAARVVRFFDRKDCISAHGDDAMYIARAFYKVRRARAGGRV